MGNQCCRTQTNMSDINQIEDTQNNKGKNSKMINEILSSKCETNKITRSNSNTNKTTQKDINTNKTIRKDSNTNILLIADCSVEESHIFNKFFYEFLTPRISSTANLGFKIKIMRQDNDQLRELAQDDMTGELIYQNVYQDYYKTATGCQQFYDTKKMESFKNISKWTEGLKNEAPKDCKILVVGNKTDFDQTRQVNFYKAKYFAESLGFEYTETNAMDNFILVQKQEE